MIFVSVVSHNHFDLIRKMGCLEKLAKHAEIRVIVRDNINESNFEEWCNDHDLIYSFNDRKKGFGENNNLNFDLANKEGVSDGDYFLVLNPDLIINPKDLIDLKELMEINNVSLGTINLYKDDKFEEYDNSVRRFPTIKNFLYSILFNYNSSIINKDNLNEISYVDWASGSFLMFKVDLYKELNGFDESYFMYCEDIDICRRYSQLNNNKLLFSKNIKGVHYARFNNRKILSNHFFWHLKSTIRYLMKFR